MSRAKMWRREKSTFSGATFFFARAAHFFFRLSEIKPSIFELKCAAQFNPRPDEFVVSLTR